MRAESWDSREAVTPGAARPSPHRILVIEDDKDSREGLRELLEAWGHAVDVAEGGPQGIQHVIEKRPRVALIDIGLPGVDGYEVARRIRSLSSSDEIFLVALTGYVDSEDHREALACGFDAYLSKPVNYEKLSSLLTLTASGR